MFETAEFGVEACERPLHSRENGGHLIVRLKQHFAHRHELPLPLAHRLMTLTMIVGEALMVAMRQQRVAIVRNNYQDNGNWAYKKAQPDPQLHVHIYGRTYGEIHPDNDPRFQAFPDALVFPDPATGYYDQMVPLTTEDCAVIKIEIEKLLRSDKYIAFASELS